MRSEIPKKQNELDNLRCLAAQRQLYSNAKNMLALQIALTIFVIVGLSIVNVFYDIEWILASASVLITLLDVAILSKQLTHYKDQAAGIQEFFDTTVLDLEWNSLIEKPRHETIYRYSEDYKKKEDDYTSLKDWYPPQIEKLEPTEAKIICQRSNCVYDLSLRENYINKLMLLALFSGILIIVLGLIKGVTFENFFVILLVPLLPIMSFSIQKFQENKKSIAVLNKMRDISNELWNKILNNEAVDTDKIIRQLQDGIYLNRKESPLIFDWFYRLLRNRLENAMNYNVEQLIKEYRERKNQKHNH